MIPHTLAALAPVRWLGLAIDWTMWDITLPTGQRMRYQMLRIAVPVHGRALPLVQLAYDRDDLPADRSQTSWKNRLWQRSSRCCQPVSAPSYSLIAALRARRSSPSCSSRVWTTSCA